MAEPARFALFGHPVDGSLSPPMHNAAFAALGLEARYGTRDVRPDDFGPVVTAAVQRGLQGANLTVPHKVRGLDLCDTVSSEARRAGAVNTLVLRGGRCHGFNTDVAALKDVLQLWARNRRANRFRLVVVGAGGAARAAALAGLEAGAASVVLVARRPERAVAVARALRDGLGLSDGTVIGAAGLDHFLEHPQAYGSEAVIQASSAPDGALAFGALFHHPRHAPGGLSGPPGLLPPPPSLAVELNYRPPESAFLRLAREAGAHCVDGLEILWRQGEKAFQLFTGLEPPPGVMARAARRAAGLSGGGPPC